jgi:hypothetical protein
VQSEQDQAKSLGFYEPTFNPFIKGIGRHTLDCRPSELMILLLMGRERVLPPFYALSFPSCFVGAARPLPCLQ